MNAGKYIFLTVLATVIAGIIMNRYFANQPSSANEIDGGINTNPTGTPQ